MKASLKARNIPQTLKYSPHLDGLRGIAFLLVFFYHAESKYFTFGWIGVDLFFVLSGFLITKILRSSIDKSLPEYLKVFFARRVLRIFPLYYAVVLFFIFIFPLIGEYVGVKTDLHNLKNYTAWFITYMQNFYIGIREEFFSPGFLNHFWTLAIEEHFYLFWPFVIYFFPHKLLLMRLSLVIISLVVASRFISIYYGVNPPLIHYSTFYRIDTLLMGSLLAIITEGSILEKHLKVKTNGFIRLTAIAITVILLAVGSLHDGKYLQVWSYSILAVGFALIIALIYYQSSLFNFLQIRWLIFIGKISYGCYVFHYPIYLLLKNRLDDFLIDYLNIFLVHLIRDSLILGLTIMISYLSFMFFEKQFLKLKRHFKYKK